VTIQPSLSKTKAPHAAAARSNYNWASAEESWDNEGGNASRSEPGSPLLPKVSQALSIEIARLTEQVRTMTLRLNDDFVSALIGTRHKTYEHRSRVLRQLNAQLSGMRLIPAVAGSRS
jgi:hypothetical protein